MTHPTGYALAASRTVRIRHKKTGRTGVARYWWSDVVEIAFDGSPFIHGVDVRDVVFIVPCGRRIHA